MYDLVVKELLDAGLNVVGSSFDGKSSHLMMKGKFKVANVS